MRLLERSSFFLFGLCLVNAHWKNIFLLNDEQMSNKVGVEHQPVVASKMDLCEIGRKGLLKEKVTQMFIAECLIH